MSELSCYCGDDGDWWYIESDDYAPLATKRSRKCCSCKQRIDVGDLTLRLDCFRYAEHAVEINIYGDGGEVPMASRYLCERCADLHLSLTELGYCINCNDDRVDLVRQYAEMKTEERKR